MNTYAFTKTQWSPELDSLHNRVDGLAGLTPGDILIYDFRESECPVISPLGAISPPSQLKVVQWNIERGYTLEGIIDELKRLDADVVLLQELDISCQRSEYKNVPLEIAKGLGAFCAFVCEFHELPSTPTCKRNADSESGCCFAFHGNAIVSKRRLVHSLRAFEHSCGLDWEACGVERKEPRKGSRYVLTGCVDVLETHATQEQSQGSEASPAVPFTHSPTYQSHFTRVQLYTIHLEIFCGPLMRLRQLSDAIADAKTNRRRFYTAMHSGVSAANSTSSPCGDGSNVSGMAPFYGDGRGSPDTLLASAKVSAAGCIYLSTPPCPSAVPLCQRHFSVVIGGDLNTIMHGIVRFSSLYSDDRTRWMSLGETEAEWLQRKVFALPRGQRSLNTRAACPQPAADTPSTRADLNDALEGGGKHTSWRDWLRAAYWRYCFGVQVEYSARLSNEELKLFDVFDKLRDITLDNPAYKGFVTGKLDWLLLSNVRVVSKSIGNHDYALSDHKYLANTIVLPPFIANGSVVEGIRSPTLATSATTTNNGVCPVRAGTNGFFWDDESLSDAYNSHRDQRAVITSVVRFAFVGAAAALAIYAPSKLATYIRLGGQK